MPVARRAGAGAALRRRAAGRCIALVQAAIAAFGRIDILVNNAGMSAQALFEEVTDLGWYEQLMRINLWGSVWCTHAALPHLKAARGRIVAVASLAGPDRRARPHRLQRDQVRDDRLLRGAARRARAGRRQRDHRLPGRRRDADPPPRLRCAAAGPPARAASTSAAR